MMGAEWKCREMEENLSWIRSAIRRRTKSAVEGNDDVCYKYNGNVTTRRNDVGEKKIMRP